MWSTKVTNFIDDKMRISGEMVPFKKGVLLHSDLRYWVKNPRIYSIVHATDVPLEQDEIELELQKCDHVKQLIRDIKHHKGLITPVFVLDKKFEVIEGNSRLAAIRALAAKQPTQFGKMECIVFPADINEKLIYSFLNQEHIQGKHQWSPYEQAGVIYRLVSGGMGMEALCDELGISKRKAKSMFDIYDFMVQHKEDKPSRYSYYEVYLTNRKAKQLRGVEPNLDTRIVKEIQDAKVTAQEFRAMLPLVLDHPKERNRFISGKSSILGAYEQLEKTGKTENLVIKLDRIHDQFKAMTKDQFDELDAQAQKRAEFNLNRILTLAQNLKKKVYG